jgi:hypothetical protein
MGLTGRLFVTPTSVRRPITSRPRRSVASSFSFPFQPPLRPLILHIRLVRRLTKHHQHPVNLSRQTPSRNTTYIITRPRRVVLAISKLRRLVPLDPHTSLLASTSLLVRSSLPCGRLLEPIHVVLVQRHRRRLHHTPRRQSRGRSDCDRREARRERGGREGSRGSLRGYDE